MIAHFYTRIENRFWDWAIPTLSYNHQVHWLINRIRPLADRKLLHWLAVRAALSSLGGLASGIILFLLTVK